MKPQSVTTFAAEQNRASRKLNFPDSNATLKALCLLTVLLTFSITASAQQMQARQLDTKIENLKLTGKPEQSKLLTSLVYNTRPTLYITNQTPVLKGEGVANVIDVDASSVAVLANADSHYKTAKLLIIHLENDGDKNIKLDEVALKGFSNLKYVLFSSRVPMNDADITKMFTAKKGSQITAMYKVLEQER